nr:MAG TPA: hypothetical protein [Bacteriophage sp.]
MTCINDRKKLQYKMQINCILHLRCRMHFC